MRSQVTPRLGRLAGVRQATTCGVVEDGVAGPRASLLEDRLGIRFARHDQQRRPATATPEERGDDRLRGVAETERDARAAIKARVYLRERRHSGQRLKERDEIQRADTSLGGTRNQGRAAGVALARPLLGTRSF